MTSPELAWLVMGTGVVVYTLTAGADFGAGLWHLLSRGERRARERAALEHAIAPIWEANHVWIIFVVVVLFSVFPRAFAAIGTALHVPISLALLGVVLRGAAFVFHTYDPRPGPARERWSLVFGVSSVLTPLVLGSVLAALGSGEIRWDGARVTSGFFAGWLSPFSLATGFFALTLFALLAAVYMTAETDGAVREAFRKRALRMEVASGAMAALVFLLSGRDAPELHRNLLHTAFTWPIQAATAGAAVGTIALVRAGRDSLARIAAAAQVALVVLGFGLAMNGAIVMPDLTLETSGARADIAGAVLVAVAAGTVLLAPSLWYLFRVFKGERHAGKQGTLPPG